MDPNGTERKVYGPRVPEGGSVEGRRESLTVHPVVLGVASSVVWTRVLGPLDSRSGARPERVQWEQDRTPEKGVRALGLGGGSRHRDTEVFHTSG